MIDPAASDRLLPFSSVPIVSVAPITLESPAVRGEDLRLRVSAPVEGGDLPILLFSHGFGNSMDGYAPLVDYWAECGFVVLQPTYLDSRRLGLAEDDPRTPSIWRFRVEDAKRTLDRLDLIEKSVPGLDGRLDRSRIVAVGHSFGAHTTGMLLGSRTIRPNGELDADMADPRIQAGILLSAGGRGGDALTPFAAERLPYLDQDYSRLTTPTLVVAGDQDRSPLTVLGPEWFADAFHLSPGAEWLVTLFGGEHMLGGISGYRAAETTDETPARVAAVRELTSSYLRSALGLGDDAWIRAREALATTGMGRVVAKRPNGPPRP